MEPERFDRLARIMGGVSSRRAALRGMAGGVGAGFLAVLARSENGDAKRKDKKKQKQKRRECNNANGCKQPQDPCQEGVCRRHKCRKQTRADGATCGDGLECQQGQCDCPNGICTLTVRPSSLNGWDLAQDSEIEFVSGPETPPLGVGSVHITTIDITKSTLANQDFADLPIDQIETLGYSTYVTNGGNTGVVAPAIKLPVLYNGGEFTTLVFEPTYTENSDVVAEEWQTWNTLSTDARWWSTRAIPEDNPTICEDDCFVSWDDVLAAIPDAAIVGALLIETGSGADDADGNVDALAINNVIYNFEPDTQ